MASNTAKIIPLNCDISVKPKVSPLGRTGRESQRPVRPLRTWSISIVDLGAPAFTLRCALLVQIEDYGVEVVASWPEVEAWASGVSEAEAIDRLKDEIVALHRDLSTTSERELGRLPSRWKSALRAVIMSTGGPEREPG